MKKLRLLCVGMLVLGLLFSTAIVLASPAAADQGSKPVKTTTPGAKATEKANARGPEQPGKPVPGAKATEKADERATEKSGKADESKKPKEGKGELRVYQGIVDAVGDQSLTLKLSSNAVITVVVSDTVKVNVQGVKPRATLSDVEVGARVLVQVRKAADGSLTAVHINAFPPKPEKRQRVGIVTEYTPGVSITIQGKDGLAGTDGVTTTHTVTTTYILTTTTVILPAGRSSQLAVGVRVTIIAPHAAAKGSQLVAQGIVIHPANATDVEEPGATK